jgi:imidazole glycerol-phosphate synthase subunit HisH
MITVVDYGMGNLRNVRRAFEELGVQVQVTSDPGKVREAERLILPGVGAFGEAVRRIDALMLRKPVIRHVKQGKPLLGVCLGMQLLFARSEESPGMQGLGILEGEVVRFAGDVKVPHIGWNDAVPRGGSVLFDGLGTECFYFVHSYYVPDSSSAVAHTSYGVRFVSAVQSGNVFGVQFHPEKSQSAGSCLLRNFVGFAGVGSSAVKHGSKSTGH